MLLILFIKLHKYHACDVDYLEQFMDIDPKIYYLERPVNEIPGYQFSADHIQLKSSYYMRRFIEIKILNPLGFY